MTDTSKGDHFKKVGDAYQTIKKFISHSQLTAMSVCCVGDEQRFMFDKILEFGKRIDEMPKTYEQDGKGDEATAYLHYFKGGMDWYITEKDQEAEQLQAYGLADFGYGEPEMGYISIEELKENNVELDLFFKPQTLSKVKEYLKSIGKLVIAAALATTLSACAETKWIKPSSTPADWQTDKYECLVEGARRVPVSPAFAVRNGYSFNSRNCDYKGRNCSTSSSYAPPSMVEYDANEPLREEAVKACLYRKGWSEIKL